MMLEVGRSGGTSGASDTAAVDSPTPTRQSKVQPLQGAAVITTDPKGVIVNANVQASKLFGWTLLEMIGENCTMLMEPALRPLHDDFLQRFIRTKEARVIDQRERRVYGINKAGKKLALLLSLTVMRAVEGLTFVAVFQKSDSSCVKVKSDPAGKIIQISKNCKGSFGYSSDELFGENVSILCAEPHRSKHEQYIRRYNTFGNPHVLGVARNLFAQHRNGSTFPISLHVKMIHHGYSARIYVLDHLTEVVLSTEKGIILDASDTCHQIFGCIAEQLKGKNVCDVLENLDPDTSGRPWHSKCFTADGGVLDVVVNAVQVQNSRIVRFHITNAESEKFDAISMRGSSYETTSSDENSSGTLERRKSVPEDREHSLGLYLLVRVSSLSFLLLCFY